MTNTTKLDQSETYRQLVNRLAPRMLTILRDLSAYEDDRPAEGTRGAVIYHDVVELLAEVDLCPEKEGT